MRQMFSIKSKEQKLERHQGEGERIDTFLQFRADFDAYNVKLKLRGVLYHSIHFLIFLQLKHKIKLQRTKNLLVFLHFLTSTMWMSQRHDCCTILYVFLKLVVTWTCWNFRKRFGCIEEEIPCLCLIFVRRIKDLFHLLPLLCYFWQVQCENATEVVHIYHLIKQVVILNFLEVLRKVLLPKIGNI